MHKGLKMLRQDHLALTAAVAEVAITTDDERAATLLDAFRDGLDTHLELEEEFLYPLLEEAGEARQLVDDSYSEHDRCLVLVDEIIENRYPFNARRYALQQVQECLLKHTSTEELQVFPLAQKLLGDWELARLYEAGMRERRAFLERAQQNPAESDFR